MTMVKEIPWNNNVVNVTPLRSQSMMKSSFEREEQIISAASAARGFNHFDQLKGSDSLMFSTSRPSRSPSPPFLTPSFIPSSSVSSSLLSPSSLSPLHPSMSAPTLSPTRQDDSSTDPSRKRRQPFSPIFVYSPLCSTTSTIIPNTIPTPSTSNQLNSIKPVQTVPLTTNILSGIQNNINMNNNNNLPSSSINSTIQGRNVNLSSVSSTYCPLPQTQKNNAQVFLTGTKPKSLATQPAPAITSTMMTTSNSCLIPSIPGAMTNVSPCSTKFRFIDFWNVQSQPKKQRKKRKSQEPTDSSSPLKKKNVYDQHHQQQQPEPEPQVMTSKMSICNLVN